MNGNWQWWIQVGTSLGLGAVLLKVVEYLLTLPGKRLETQVQLKLRQMDESGALRDDLHELWMEAREKLRLVEAERDAWQEKYNTECRVRIKTEEDCSKQLIGLNRQIAKLEGQLAEETRQRREAEQKLIGFAHIQELFRAKGVDLMLLYQGWRESQRELGNEGEF